jgi:hypothetical protein
LLADANAAELHDHQLAYKRAQSGKALKELEHETFEIRCTRSSRSCEHDDPAEVTRIELANIGKIEVAGDQATAAFVRNCRYDVVPCAGCRHFLDVHRVMTACMKHRHHRGR